MSLSNRNSINMTLALSSSDVLLCWYVFGKLRPCPLAASQMYKPGLKFRSVFLVWLFLFFADYVTGVQCLYYMYCLVLFCFSMDLCCSCTGICFDQEQERVVEDESELFREPNWTGEPSSWSMSQRHCILTLRWQKVQLKYTSELSSEIRAVGWS